MSFWILFNWNNNKEAGTICFDVRIPRKESDNSYGTIVESDDIRWALSWEILFFWTKHSSRNIKRFISIAGFNVIHCTTAGQSYAMLCCSMQNCWNSNFMTSKQVFIENWKMISWKLSLCIQHLFEIFAWKKSLFPPSSKLA